MAKLDVDRHLREQMSAADPWNLDRNPFEAKRYAVMRDLLEPFAPFGDALEVGCAAGAFTVHLAALSRRVHLVDRMPEALDRAAARVGSVAGLTWEVADVGAGQLAPRRFDAIVAAEVLYFLPGREELERAIETLVERLAPGGVFLLGSARDEVVARWGMWGGAETTMDVLERHLTRASLVHVTGADAGEDSYAVLYRHRAPELRD
jgi:SAM-dependent methyltransferase